MYTFWLWKLICSFTISLFTINLICTLSNKEQTSCPNNKTIWNQNIWYYYGIDRKNIPIYLSFPSKYSKLGVKNGMLWRFGEGCFHQITSFSLKGYHVFKTFTHQAHYRSLGSASTLTKKWIIKYQKLIWLIIFWKIFSYNLQKSTMILS